MDDRTGLTRRGFLAGITAAGITAAAGVGLAGCGSTEAEGSGEASSGSAGHTWDVAPQMPSAEEIVETIDCEIIIVGGGISGVCGALLAADKGINVHVLEKANKVGLSREMSIGWNSQFQKDIGFIVDRETKDAILSQFYASTSVQLGAIGQIQENHEHSVAFMNTAGRMIEWLAPILIEEGIDVHIAADPLEYGNPMFFSYGVAGNPPDPWNEAAQTAAEKRGAVFHFLTAAYMLVQDDAGRVTGVIATNTDGEYMLFNASKGVLLSAGGIGSDPEMMDAYFWGNERITHQFNYPSHTGDMHKAASWIGAGLDTLYWGDAFLCSTNKDARITRVGSTTDYHGFDDTWPAAPGVGQLGVLWLDVAGRRCTNEMGDIMVKATRPLSLPKGQVWAIWDGAWESKFGGLIPQGDWATYSPFVTWFAMNTQAQIDEDIKNGVTIRCDSLEQVAEVTGMDPEIMMQSIEDYNAACLAGYDEVFHKDPAWMTTVDTPPFYVAGIGYGNCVTRGGIWTEGHLRVVSTEGKTIPGLWAAGTTAGGVWGFGRIMGSVPLAQNTAWRAVHDILGEEPPEVDWPTRAELGLS